MIQDYALDAVLHVMQVVGREIVAPASPEAIAELDQWFIEHAGQPLPDGYRSLLQRCNGLNFAGLTVCGTSDGKGVVGLPETQGRLNVDRPSALRYFGQFWTDLMALHLETGHWALISPIDHEAVGGQVFESFDEVFAFAVALCLEKAFPEGQA